MKVLYDNQIFMMQKIGGISRYFVELMKNSNYLFEYSVSLKYSDNLYLKDLNLFKPLICNKYFKGKGFLTNQINNLYQNKMLSKLNFDILHPTYFNPNIIKKLPSEKKLVLTVYDMIYEIFPNLFNDANVIQEWKKEMLYKSDKIIAISDCTKKDILKFYPDIKEEKISVVHLASSFPISENFSKQNYILFTGARYEYKNFVRFVRAVAPLLKKYNLQLICTGSSFSALEESLLEELEIKNFVKQVFASDAKLVELYANALFFVFPSIYEGFGIPILEAFASSCPLILSNASCFPEIAKDAAVYFDPFSIEDMTKQMENVISSETLRNELREKGKERLKNFSWQKTTEQTAQVYKSVL